MLLTATAAVTVTLNPTCSVEHFSLESWSDHVRFQAVWRSASGPVTATLALGLKVTPRPLLKAEVPVEGQDEEMLAGDQQVVLAFIEASFRAC